MPLDKMTYEGKKKVRYSEKISLFHQHYSAPGQHTQYKLFMHIIQEQIKIAEHRPQYIRNGSK